VKRHISYHALISACTQGRKWQLALCLLGTMALALVERYTICYHALISACTQGQEWQLAVGLLSTM
jgi:pentatricopeptide repeat protein